MSTVIHWNASLTMRCLSVILIGKSVKKIESFYKISFFKINPCKVCNNVTSCLYLVKVTNLPAVAFL